MSPETDIARLLAEAHRSGTTTIDATTLDFDRAAAYRIAVATQELLGEATGMLKTGIHPDGVGIVAPIYASHVGRGADFALPAARVMGLEFEIGVVLGRDIANDPAIDEAAVAAAVDHYFTGVELVGSRFVDRTKASAAVGLADNVSAFGYVIGERHARGSDFAGLSISFERDGERFYDAPAVHGFGTVLASVVAYARAQQPHAPLTAGTIITTGSMCGLVPAAGPGRYIGRLGDETVAFVLN